MNRRGDTDNAMDSIIYLILCIFLFLTLLWFVNSYNHGSAFYEDFYSKEIVNIITKPPIRSERIFLLSLNVVKLNI